MGYPRLLARSRGFGDYGHNLLEFGARADAETRIAVRYTGDRSIQIGLTSTVRYEFSPAASIAAIPATDARQLAESLPFELVDNQLDDLDDTAGGCGCGGESVGCG